MSNGVPNYFNYLITTLNRNQTIIINYHQTKGTAVTWCWISCVL